MVVRVRFATEIACPEISVRRPFSKMQTNFDINIETCNAHNLACAVYFRGVNIETCNAHNLVCAVYFRGVLVHL